MPTGYIRRKSGGPATGDLTGGNCPIAVDSDNDRLYFVTSDRAGGARKKSLAASHVRIVTASFTLTSADDGAVIVADSTTSVVVTLPATQAGLKFTLVVGQVTSADGHAFSPNAADAISGNGYTVADDKDAVCVTATDRVGDVITLVGDGVGGWYITSLVGTWTRET